MNNPLVYVKALFATKQLVSDIETLSKEQDMSTIAKTLLTYALNEFVAYEPQFAAKVANETEKKLLNDAVVAIKALLPVLNLL